MMMKMGLLPPSSLSPPSTQLFVATATAASFHGDDTSGFDFDGGGSLGGCEGVMETTTTAITSSSPPYIKEEWHEFIIIYEGPPSLCSIMNDHKQKNRQTFCVSLPPSTFAFNSSSNKSMVSLSHVLEQDLLMYASIQIGWPAQLLCCHRNHHQQQQHHQQYFHPTQSIYHPTTQTIHHHHTIPITLTLQPKYTSIRGGKGGFGTLLRGQSKQAGAKMTVDFGACRDLSGRRLRHVNDELKLRKWKEVEEARRRLHAAAASSASSGDGDGAMDADGMLSSTSNLTEVELSALRTPSGIRNWHLSVPSWSDMASSTTSNKGRRKIDRQLEREVRGYQRKEEWMREEQERKRMERETSVLEYVRKGEREGGRVSSIAGSVKEDILAHLRKRKKLEERDGGSLDEVEGEEGKGSTKLVIDGSSEMGYKSVSSSSSSYLMTISGEISVLEPTVTTTTTARPLVQRIQSQSDFATAVVLLDAAKLREMRSRGGKGVYIEYTIQTAGLAQIGWIRGPSHSNSNAVFHPNSDTGDGVGDDAASYGYDGSRGLKFHGEEEEAAYGPEEKDSAGIMGWKSGDILGSYCKFSESSETAKSDDVATSNCIEIGYTLNGIDLGIAFTIPVAGDDLFHFYPALSLNLDEVVDVNVGPEFIHKCMDGCVGAVEMVMSEAADYEAGEGEDGLMEHNDKEKSPSSKKPRDDPLVEPKTVNETVETKSMEEGGNANDNTVFDLNNCNSVDELKALGPDRLKNIMLSMGVKCGGTTDERANRLFSLKGLRRNEYPNKIRGKNFIL